MWIKSPQFTSVSPKSVRLSFFFYLALTCLCTHCFLFWQTLNKNHNWRYMGCYESKVALLCIIFFVVCAPAMHQAFFIYLYPHTIGVAPISLLFASLWRHFLSCCFMIWWRFCSVSFSGCCCCCCFSYLFCYGLNGRYLVHPHNIYAY